MIHILNTIRCTHQMVQLVKHQESSLPQDARGLTARVHFIFMACVFAFDALTSSLQFGGVVDILELRKAEAFERIGLTCISAFVPKNEQNKMITSLNLLSTCALVTSFICPQLKVAYYGLSLIDAAFRSYQIAKEIRTIF